MSGGFAPPPETMCDKCDERVATIRWEWAPAHFAAWYCKVCALTEQLDHARERAAAISELERELDAALSEEGR